MFGDKLILGTNIIKIDSKGRIIMPAFTFAEPNDCLVLETKNEYLEFFLYEEYLQLAKRLNIMRKNATSIEEFKKINEEINDICLHIACSNKLDKQKRFQISKYVLKEANIHPGDELLAQGGGSSLILKKRR